MAQQLPSKSFLDLWRCCSSQPGHWQLLWPRNQTLQLPIWPTRKTWVSQRPFLKLNCQRVSTSTSQGLQLRIFDQMLALTSWCARICGVVYWAMNIHQRIFLSRFLFRQCNYSCGFCFHTAKTSFLLPIEVPDKNKQTWFSNTAYKLGDIYRWGYSFFLIQSTCIFYDKKVFKFASPSFATRDAFSWDVVAAKIDRPHCSKQPNSFIKSQWKLSKLEWEK